MNSHRQTKNEQLTQLASEVSDGVIVELGAYRGEGTVALCQGAKVPVYAIDIYSRNLGWAGEKYTSVDRLLFAEAIKRAGVSPVLIVRPIQILALTWDKGDIGLLFWDLGKELRLLYDFHQWQDKVTGKFVVHDTDDQRLGSKELNPIGWRKWEEGVFWILQREQ